MKNNDNYFKTMVLKDRLVIALKIAIENGREGTFETSNLRVALKYAVLAYKIERDKLF
jgi:hypothetical protein